MLPPTTRTYVNFGQPDLTDGRGIEWLNLVDGTASDRELVSDYTRSGLLRRGERLLDFRIPTTNARRGVNFEPPSLGEVLDLREPSYPDVVVATAVVVATFFDPRGRGGRSSAVGRAKVGRWRWL